MVFSQPFPSINKLAGFVPGARHFKFCAEHGVGISLLHSHGGFSELCFFDDHRQSRPPTPQDKLVAAPMSFYINKRGDLVPYEWTLCPSRLRERPACLSPDNIKALGKELLRLCKVTNLALGVTLGPVVDGQLELEIVGKPGWHKYLSKQQAAKHQTDPENINRVTYCDVQRYLDGSGAWKLARCEQYCLYRWRQEEHQDNHETIG